ncbi:MAG: ABC transporter permease [Deltaproteobacteria bacterium CG_4_9_14_3_um_filter_65_9]|nr:MAG: ABC transporter permease [Deltaproteobacteria bacterium CG_4_9_14_3_um_filter_65_9]
MDLSFLTVQVLSALRQAAFLFLISSGLTLIFGVLNILNFAHGALYMLGAYFVYALTLHLTGPAGFLIAILAAPLGVALIATGIETGLLRRIYAQEEIYQLLLTYALVLIIDDLAKIVFGPEFKSIPKPEMLSGSVTLFGGTVPVYTLLVVVLAPTVALILWYLLYKTKTGKVVRATSSDREMADALGINMSALFTLVFAFGAVLAGLGGALAGPARTVFPGVGTEVIIESFVVVVIGGLGNLWGALIGSLLIGSLETIGIIVFPEFEMSLIYLLMVAVLVVRPWGLFGRPFKVKALSEKNLAMEAQEISPVHFSVHPVVRWAPFLLLLLVPLFTGRFYQYLLTQIFIASLMAIAFNLLLGTTGLLSFGQAAFFGVGAYTVGLLLTQGGFETLPALVLAPVVAALAAGIIGFFCVRLSGVHFAMLTLAFGQLIFTVAYKWYGLTGGDNGIQGIPVKPIPLGGLGVLDIGSTQSMYYFVLVVVGLSVELLRRIRSSPFGATLKAIRENGQRASFLGVNILLYRWTAFVVAGAFTGLAGGLFAMMEKAISPEIIHWSKSSEPVFMAIIGGIYTFAGPAVGAVVYVILNSYLVAWTEKWALVLGLVLLTLVLLLPGGVVGFVNEKARQTLGKLRCLRKWSFSKSATS